MIHSKIGELVNIILIISLIFTVGPPLFSYRKLSVPEPLPLDYSKVEFITSCDRQDVDPCSFLSNGAFAQNLQSVLNNLLANCPARNWDCNPSPCCTESKYYSLNRTFNGLNPWFFCRNRTECYSYDCSSDPVNGAALCNYASVALQDSMLAYCRSLANAGKPYCACSMVIFAVSTAPTE